MPREATDLTPQQRVALLRGAYDAIDGLWFMAVEERFGNAAARELDAQVWRRWGGVVAKRIQRDVGLPAGEVEALAAALALWFDLEGYAFEVRPLGRDGGPAGESEAEGLEMSVSGCPWWEAMCRSGRRGAVDCSAVELGFLEGLAGRLSPRWRVEVDHARPRGDASCRARFRLE